MNSNQGVYDYVIESINNILEKGIQYYDATDENLKLRLTEIYQYINNETDEKPKEEVKEDAPLVSKDAVEKVNDKVESKNNEISIFAAILEKLKFGRDDKVNVQSAKDNDNPKAIQLPKKEAEEISVQSTEKDEAIEPVKENDDIVPIAETLKINVESASNQEDVTVADDVSTLAVENSSLDDDLFDETSFDIKFDFDDDNILDSNTDEIESIPTNEKKGSENRSSIIDIFKNKNV